MKKQESLKVNIAYQTFYRLLSIIMPLITSPYIARVLGAEGIGIYSYSYSIVTYFLLIAKLGIENYGNRTIASVRDDQQKLNQTFSDIYSLHFIITLLVIIGYFIFCQFRSENRNIYYIQGIYLVAQLFDINWFYFGIEKFRITVTRNSLFKIGTVVCVFLFVKSPQDTWKYVLILAAGSAISESLVWIFIRKYITFRKPNVTQYKQILKPLLLLFIPTIAVSLYKVMDKIMLGAMSNLSEVGYYENSEKIISICIGFVSALGTVMLPRSANLLAAGNIKENQKLIDISIKVAFIASYAMSFGLIAISSTFPILFWGKDFSACQMLLSGLAITLPFTSIANVIRTQYLMPREMDKEYIVSVFCGAVVNLAINFLLIPKFNAVGAVVGTICAEFTVCMVQILYVRSSLPIWKYVKRSIPYLGVGLIMALSVRCIGYAFKISGFLLFIQLLIGVAIYGCLTLIYMSLSKDELFNKFVKRIKK